MATVHPFRALRPAAAVCSAVASVPYDVISVPEARALYKGNPLSFLRVVRPEVDLPVGTDEHADEVYDTGARNLEHYAASNHSVLEEQPALYVYRLQTPEHSKSGLFCCVTVEEYLAGAIRKHENTRPPKVADRTRHLVTQRAHAEPVMLAYRDSEAVDALVGEVQQSDPLYDFVADDGVRHTAWQTFDTAPLIGALEKVPRLYVADGHHRCQAAAEAHQALGLPGTSVFPAVLFPVSQVRIMSYNRVVRGTGASDALAAAPIAWSAPTSQAEPECAGQVCAYMDGRWHVATLPPTRRDGVADTLDVARLSEYVLEPVFGIHDQRTDPNIAFVGGIRGVRALEQKVGALGDAVAFSMYPTSMEELILVSDANQLMPPKSTWFEPKLRSGLLVHGFDPVA